MDIKSLVFYAFAAILVLAALKVITARNPVHSALFLVLSFFTASGIWMLLQAEFLAITLVLVYVGTVMVLFLFVVMMIDINLEKIRRDFSKYVPMAILIGAVIIAEMAVVLVRGFFLTDTPLASKVVSSGSNTRDLGKLIYTEYLYAFEVAGIILLVAIIASVALTLRRRKDSKAQNVSAQIRVKAADRVRIVAMPAEKEEA
ncbi:MAG: NADH-quinone oxidoreductase subunit J [Candidatus Protistobacter heckmanni]|nr:NADH-quinone oxidoreductase subunit J [Candidatus Protistobacter heckmanni]